MVACHVCVAASAASCRWTHLDGGRGVGGTRLTIAPPHADARQHDGNPQLSEGVGGAVQRRARLLRLEQRRRDLLGATDAAGRPRPQAQSDGPARGDGGWRPESTRLWRAVAMACARGQHIGAAALPRGGTFGPRDTPFSPPPLRHLNDTRQQRDTSSARQQRDACACEPEPVGAAPAPADAARCCRQGAERQA